LFCEHDVEATVFAHEGRHALDQHDLPDAFRVMTDDERELRAKLSEVAFASDPKLALTGSVIGARLDESTGHGRATCGFATCSSTGCASTAPSSPASSQACRRSCRSLGSRAISCARWSAQRTRWRPRRAESRNPDDMDSADSPAMG